MDMDTISERKLLFIGGLHKSGTSILHRILSDSDQVSGFSNTGVIEDEGQHLQDVYKPAYHHGGPGRFAFDADAGLDESSDLVNDRNRMRLLASWGKYWDKTSKVLVEKSPPNMIRMRFLQSMFPGSYFINIIRHPLAVALATRKWSETSVDELVRHWIAAYTIYFNDSKHIEKKLLISYEEMLGKPDLVFARISAFLDVPVEPEDRLNNSNQKYFGVWNEMPGQEPEVDRELIIQQYEQPVNTFGYSLVDLDRFPTMTALEKLQK